MTLQTRRRVLIVSYHFPPVQGSSGVHRILACAKYLPEFGWEPVILTVNPRAYPRVESANAVLVPDRLKVVRCFALDSKRHFAVGGRYPAFLALPDRWQSWIPAAVVRGLRLIREMRPALVMSSFPIASANVIAHALQKRTGTPWIADLRDPIVLENHPPPGLVRRISAAIERKTFERAARIVVTTPGALELYKRRYEGGGGEKVRLVENGVDPDMFHRAREPGRTEPRSSSLKMLHSGLVYPEARDPRPLFRALASMAASGELMQGELEIVFRASGQAEFINSEAQRFGVARFVSTRSVVDYESAIREMQDSDSLLLIQSSDCNDQIPAKVYEYLYCRKPILALTPPEGDTGRLLSRRPNVDLVSLDDEDGISSVLRRHIQKLRNFIPPPGKDDFIETLSRKSRTAALADVFSELV